MANAGDAWLTKLPVSQDWFRILTKLKARNVLAGALAECSTIIDKPYWCLQLENVVDDSALVPDIEAVIAFVSVGGMLGHAPFSENPHPTKYQTFSFTMFPCNCFYDYAGAASIKKHKPLVVGAYTQVFI